jgi:hypothetical protein
MQPGFPRTLRCPAHFPTLPFLLASTIYRHWASSWTHRRAEKLRARLHVGEFGTKQLASMPQVLFCRILFIDFNLALMNASWVCAKGKYHMCMCMGSIFMICMSMHVRACHADVITYIWSCMHDFSMHGSVFVCVRACKHAECACACAMIGGLYEGNNLYDMHEYACASMPCRRDYIYMIMHAWFQHAHAHAHANVHANV